VRRAGILVVLVGVQIAFVAAAPNVASAASAPDPA
jgi:hypothetical protein